MANPKDVLKSVMSGAVKATGAYMPPPGGRSPIPDLADLAQRHDWRGPRSMAGVAGANLDEQLAFIDSLLTPEIAAVLKARDIYAEVGKSSGESGGFLSADTEVLYALVRALKPPRIVQVGTWVSAPVIALAAADAVYKPDYTIIEPVPRPYVEAEAKRGGVKLVNERVQVASLDLFTQLQVGDLLFIDTNHAVKVDGQVNRLVLDVLPRLAPGVLVHFHNINFPYDYCRGVLADDASFATEVTVLHAFLSGNAGYRIAASLSMLHYGAQAQLKARLPHYVPASDSDGLIGASRDGEWPSSLWLQRVRT